MGLLRALAAVCLLGALTLASALTPASARVPAAVPATDVTPPVRGLTVATYNVCKTDCAAPAPPWSVRRDRLARVVGALGADVVGLQEATQIGLPGRRIDQWTDIQRVVAPLGYAAPPVRRAHDTCSVHRCVHTARLLYRSSTVEPVRAADGSVAAGYAALRDLAGGLAPETGAREVAWAFLRGRNAAGPFLAVSMHLPSGKDARSEADRVAVANGITAWADALGARWGMRAAATVLLADLNSFDRRQPDGAQAVLRRAGWSDAWHAPVRRNIAINSTNYSPTSRSGWPARPLRNASGVASRVDYVLFRGAGVVARSYRVAVWLEPDGSFATAYRASDHNPVRARLEFAAPG